MGSQSWSGGTYQGHGRKYGDLLGLCGTKIFQHAFVDAFGPIKRAPILAGGEFLHHGITAPDGRPGLMLSSPMVSFSKSREKVSLDKDIREFESWDACSSNWSAQLQKSCWSSATLVRRDLPYDPIGRRFSMATWEKVTSQGGVLALANKTDLDCPYVTQFWVLQQRAQGLAE